MAVLDRFPTPAEIRAATEAHPVPFTPGNPKGIVGSLWFLRYANTRVRAVVISLHQRDPEWILFWDENAADHGTIHAYGVPEGVVYARTLDPMTGEPTE